MEIVLGIDPGFTVTGYSILQKNNNQIALIDYGYLKLPSSKSLDHRVGIFYDFFQTKIQEKAVTTVALETSFLGRNAQTFLKLGYLRGILYLLSSQNNLNIQEFAPRQIKQAVTGHGGATKDQVAHVLAMLFPKLPPQEKNDVTDAIAISLCGVWQNANRLAGL